MFGLWPFNLNPFNEVKRSEDGKSISLYGRGILFSKTPLVIFEKNILNPDSLSIELAILPQSENIGYIACIFSLYDGYDPPPLLIGQWKTHLIIRFREVHSKSAHLHREISINNALKKGENVVISIVTSENNTSIYLNENLSKSYSNYSPLKTNMTLSGQIVVGNSPSGDAPWQGEIHSLKVHTLNIKKKHISNNYFEQKKGKPQTSREITSLKNKLSKPSFKSQNFVINVNNKELSLFIPEKFKILKKNILVPPWIDSRINFSTLKDMAVNIFGFIPFGFFLTFCFKVNRGNYSNSKNYFITVLVGFLISLSIELIQVNIPERSSSLTDLLLNTLGTLFGVFLFHISSRNLSYFK